jgi:hypothetical protein
MQFKLCYETGYKVKVKMKDGTHIIGIVDTYKRITQDFHTRLDLCVEYQDTKGVTKYMWVPDYRTKKV